MKHAFSAAILVSLAAHAASAQSGHMPTDQVIAPIVEGTKSKKPLMATAGSDTPNQFTIAVLGPHGRVVSFAADKAMKFQTITAHECRVT